MARVPVGTSRLRRLYWARPLAPADLERASTEITGYDEEKALLNSAVKATDGFFTTFFVSPYSKYIARWAARRGWTPNGVSTLSMAVGVLAAAAFATGERTGMIAGALLLQVAFTLDCVDGQLARYTRTFTRLGAWLDSIFDRAKEYAVYAGLALGATHAGDDVWLLAGVALALQTARHAADFTFNAARDEVIRSSMHEPPRKRSKLLDAGAKDEPEGAPAVRWLRRIVVFPIGERFATISLDRRAVRRARDVRRAARLGRRRGRLHGGRQADALAGRAARDRRCEQAPTPTACSLSLPRRRPGRARHRAASRAGCPCRRWRSSGRRAWRSRSPPPSPAAARRGRVACAVVAWVVLTAGASSSRGLRGRLRWVFAAAAAC